MKDYKILTDIDLSSNSLYNIKSIVGNEYSGTSGRVVFDRAFRDLLITTCDVDNAGNTLIRAGSTGIGSGYVHLWAGQTTEPSTGITYKDLIDGIVIFPDKNISLVSSTSNIYLKSNTNTTIETDSTFNIKDGSTTSAYTTDSITDETITYNLNVTTGIITSTDSFTLNNTNLVTITSDDYSISSNINASADNYASGTRFSINVNDSNSKLIVKDILSYNKVDLLHANISGDIDIGNRYSNGASTTEQFNRTLKAKGNIADIEYKGNIWYVKDHSEDVFRLVAFGDSKPTIVGEGLPSGVESNYSKLTIQYIDVLKDFKADGNITLGSLDSNLTFLAKKLTIDSSETEETHDLLDVKASTNNIYHLSVTSDDSTLDIDNLKVHESLVIDKGRGAGTLDVTGSSTFRDDIVLTENADTITVSNNNNTLYVKSDIITLKDLSGNTSVVILNSKYKNATISLATLELASTTGDLVIKSAEGAGNITALGTGATALIGNSLLQVDSAVIKNENVTTSNVGTINIITQANVVGGINVDNTTTTIDSDNFTIASNTSYSETHNGTYDITAGTYGVDAQADSSTVTADNFKASESITSEGTLNVTKETNLTGLLSAEGNISLTGSSNEIYSSNPITIKSDNLKLTGNSNTTGYVEYTYDGDTSTAIIKTSKFYLKEGISDSNILSYDGLTAIINVDELNSDDATFNSLTVNQDLGVSGSLHGDANIVFSNDSTTLTSSKSITITSPSFSGTYSTKYNLEVGSKGAESLTISATESESTINVDNLTVDKSTELNTKTIINGSLNLNATSNISGEITLDNTSQNIIKATNGIELTATPINIKSGDNEVDITSNGVTETLNKLEINAGSGKLSIVADDTKSSLTVDTINVTTQTTGTENVTTLNATTAKVTGSLTVTGSMFSSTTTNSTLIGDTLTIKGGKNGSNYNFDLIANPTTATLSITGATTLKGPLQVSGTITVPSIKGNPNLALTGTDITSTSIGTTTISAYNLVTSSTVATIKYGTKDSEAYQLIVADNTSTLTSTNLNSTTFVNSGLSTTENLKVKNTANFNNFTIYWDNTINSLVFAKGNL